MYWTLRSNDPPRCLYTKDDGVVQPESMCGDRHGEHADPDAEGWNLVTVSSTHPDLRAVLHDEYICNGCRDAVAAFHNISDRHLP